MTTSDFNFDFSHSRVRLNGRALSKFDLAMAIDSYVRSLPLHVRCSLSFPLVTTIYPLEFNYFYYVEKLQFYLSLSL